MEASLINWRRFPASCLHFGYSPDGRRIRFDLTDPRTDSNSHLGNGREWKGYSPTFSGLERVAIPVLRKLVAGRRLLLFSGGAWERPSHLGDAGAPFHLSQTPPAGPSRLTSGPLRFSCPVPSSDGKRLFVIGEEPRVELSRYDLQARRFDSYLPGLSAGPVDFSPDRKWMAYVSYPDMTLWRSRGGRKRQDAAYVPASASV